MRHILAILFLVFASTTASSASLTDEIEAAEARLETGLAARDVKLLEPLIADQFSWIHSSDGRVDDRKAWLENAARGMALAGQRGARTEYGASLTTHGEPVHTAVRIARVRLVNAEQKRESWIRQTHIWVRKSGQWQLIMGQGVGMYDGPPLDLPLHARYSGIYALEDGRKLTLVWQDEMLLATFPSGAQTQIFLASPTEEIVRNPLAGALRFTLDERGNPRGVALVRSNQEIWRANLVKAGDRGR